VPAEAAKTAKDYAGIGDFTRWFAGIRTAVELGVNALKIFQRKTTPPTLLIASRNPEVFAAIPDDIFQTQEAVSTRGVLEALSVCPVLMVIDLPDLVETADFPRTALAASLESVQADGIPVVSGREFLREQEQIVSAALLQTRTQTAIRFLTGRTILIANYCGGVGKTTLAMALTKRFKAASGLGTALLEIGLGGSAFNARLGGERPSFYEIVTQSSQPDQWQGVDLYPLDGREASVLTGESERTVAVLDEIIQSHTLTVIDAFPSYGLWPHLLNRATDIFVVTDPRPDALAQTDSLLQDIQVSLEALDPKSQIHLVLNKVRTLGEKISLTGQVDVSLPFDERKAQRYDPYSYWATANWSQSTTTRIGQNQTLWVRTGYFGLSNH